MFDQDRFIEDCRAAVAEDPSHKAVREVVARVVSEPAEVLKGLGEPKRAEVQSLYRSPTLTILNVIWAPWMTILPHNHRMWAVIGVYIGREDNIFWRRLPRRERRQARSGWRKSNVGARRDSARTRRRPPGRNPIPRLTGAIHVYGGDFFETPRSQWDPEALVEGPYSVERAMRIFEDANAFLAKS